MSLNRTQLWERVKKLEGHVVNTIAQHRPNKIVRVSEIEMEIEGRNTKPLLKDVYQVYDVLIKQGKITAEDLYGNTSILGHVLARKTGRILMAILVAAVPEEIEVILPSKVSRLSGIRIRA